MKAARLSPAEIAHAKAAAEKAGLRLTCMEKKPDGTVRLEFGEANQEDAELEADRDEWKQQHENLLSVRDSDIAAMVRGRDKWMLLAQRTLAYLPSSLGIAKAIRAEIDPVEIDAALARSEDAALTTKGDG